MNHVFRCTSWIARYVCIVHLLKCWYKNALRHKKRWARESDSLLLRNCLRMVLKTRGRVLGVALASKFPSINPIDHFWFVLKQQVWSVEAPPQNLQKLKYLVVTCLYHIPQNTFRCLVAFTPCWVITVLVAYEGATPY